MGKRSTLPTIAGPHHADHEPAGLDEVVDIDILNTGVLLSAHETRHRLGGADPLNHDNLAGYVAAEHLSLPNTIANVLTDHDLAHHPLAIIPTMDDVHIPDLETLSYGGPFATAQIPGLDASKIISGILAATRGGLGKALSPTWTDKYIPVYKSGADQWEMELKPTAVWTLDQTLSFTNQTGVIANVSAHDLWMIVHDIVTTGACAIVMLLNGDTGTNYYWRQLDGTTISTSSGANFPLFEAAAAEPLTGIVWFRGKLNGNDYIKVVPAVAGRYDKIMLLNAEYHASADITRIDWDVTANLMSGTIKLYYMDY